MATEKRLIDANALLRIYKKWIPQLSLPEDEGDLRGVEICIAVLEDAPTVDAVEVSRLGKLGKMMMPYLGCPRGMIGQRGEVGGTAKRVSTSP